jgi:hypothetical protein
LREKKMRHTQEKWRALGSMDMDDLPVVLPPPECRKVVRIVSGSGLTTTDALLTTFVPESNHSSGGFFGARACGKNFRRLLELHPPYIDPVSSFPIVSRRGIPISTILISAGNRISTKSTPESGRFSISART